MNEFVFYLCALIGFGCFSMWFVTPGASDEQQSKESFGVLIQIIVTPIIMTIIYSLVKHFWFTASPELLQGAYTLGICVPIMVFICIASMIYTGVLETE